MPRMADRMSRRRPQWRVRRKLRAVRGAPREEGLGGRSGSNGPEEWETWWRAVEERGRVEEWGRRSWAVDRAGHVVGAHRRVRRIVGPDRGWRRKGGGTRGAPAMPSRHMSARTRRRSGWMDDGTGGGRFNPSSSSWIGGEISRWGRERCFDRR